MYLHQLRCTLTPLSRGERYGVKVRVRVRARVRVRVRIRVRFRMIPWADGVGVCGVSLALVVVIVTYLAKKAKDSSLVTINTYLKGRVVWITGASSGLGKKLALEAASSGAEAIILSGRRKDALEAVEEECLSAAGTSASGGGKQPVVSVSIVTFDLGNEDTWEVATKSVLEVAPGGRVDILLNNAGISQRDWVMSTSIDTHKKLMNVNYLSAVALTIGVLPGMIERGYGHIIFTNSLQGKLGIARRSAYAASKHALVGFADCLRAELCSSGVQVTSVFCGYIQTSLSLNAILGDGSVYGKMDPTTQSGLEPSIASHLIWQGVAQMREEFMLAPFKHTIAVRLRNIFPGFIFRILSNYVH